MDLVAGLAHLEDNYDLHCARLLVLVDAFSGPDGSKTIDGLTKLAKLDFLLRYPVLLERALRAKNRPSRSVRVSEHERHSVESQMVRYRFGPWDHRYRVLLNILVARGLAHVAVSGRMISIGLTALGRATSNALVGSPQFADFARRAALLRSNFDMTATHLMRFIYTTFPEVVSLNKNEAISP